jgi:hypothetical protein
MPRPSPLLQQSVNASDTSSQSLYDHIRYVLLAMARRHPLLAALEPVADALGAELVSAKAALPSDIPLHWDGKLVGGLRLPGVQGTLDRMITAVEAELGAPLARLSREDKQRAVQLLGDRGAFALRKSVEYVADAMSVSRFTIYNYLNSAES